MANEKNLVSLANRSPEERRAIARKGKAASDQAKVRKRETRALIRELLAAPVEIPAKTKKALRKLGYDGDAPTVELLEIIAIANQAMAGDLASAKFLYDYAQVPDLRAQLERERLEAAREQASKPASMDVEDLTPLVKLLSSPAEGEAPRE